MLLVSWFDLTRAKPTLPAGKCTVTAASSLAQAEEVSNVVGKLIIDLFVQCRKRDMVGPSAKKQRRR